MPWGILRGHRWGTLGGHQRTRIPNDMNVPGWRLHQMTTGEWSVWVNGNWRLTFSMEGEDAVSVNYLDYH